MADIAAAKRRAAAHLKVVRRSNSKALPGIKADGNYSLAQRRAIRAAFKSLPHAKAPSKAKPYNPLAPLTGKSFGQEIKANERLQFGPQQQEINKAISDQDKNTALVGSAYDQYTAALKDAATKIDAANAAAATAAQARADAAKQQDTAAAQTDAGRASAIGAAGLRDAALTTQRGQGVADTQLNNNRAATSVKAKAEALRREGDKRADLESKNRELQKERGAFRTSERGKLRDTERTYALARKEFGLKVQTEKDQASNNKADTAAQKLIAKLYASANQAKARATIRVAKLQLRKGKIDQHQYRQMTNIYHGLPKKGKAPQPKGSASKPATPHLQTWEQDKVEKAMHSLSKDHPLPRERGVYLKKMIDGGLPPRLARIAWNKYSSGAKQYDKGNAPG